MKVSLKILVTVSVFFICTSVINALFALANLQSNLDFYGALLILLLTVLSVSRLLISIWKW